MKIGLFDPICIVRLWQRPALRALAGYSILGVIAHWPLAIHLGDFPGNDLPDFDMGQYFWQIWWVWRQIVHFQGIYVCNLVFYPTGTNLAFIPLHLFNTLFVLPFQAMGTPQIGYNLFFLACGVFSGWGLYCFCRDLKVEIHASFLAGALFLLSPYRFGQMDHFNLINTLPIPFYLLWMRRALLHGGWKGPFLWAVWLMIVANTSWHYLVFMLLLSPLWLIYILLIELDSRKRVRGLIQWLRAMGLFFLMFLPQMIAIIGAYHPTEKVRPMEVVIYWSADFLHLIVPPGFLTGLPEGGEFSAFPGILVLLLAIAGLFPWASSRGRLWLIVAGMGAMLALGPMLKVAGRPTFFWLPAYWLNKIPLLNFIRAMVRWSLLYQLGLILFVAMNYSRLERIWISRIRVSAWIPVFLIIGGTFLENWPGPFPHSDRKPPEVLRTLASIDPEGAVLHLPLAGPKEEGRYMYLQTVHGLPMRNGYPPFRPELLDSEDHPAIALLEGGEMREGLSPSVFIDDLKQLRIRWIVIHPEYYEDPSTVRWLHEVLIRRFQATPLYQEEDLRVYHLLRDYDKVPALAPLGE